VFKDTHKNFKRKKEKLCGKNIFYISPSKWMYDNIKQSFLKMEKLICIENGINLDKFYPLKDSEVLRYKYQISQDKNVLMFAAGNIKNKYKGWKYLIEALKLIEYPEKYELLVVGESNSDLESLNIETKIVGFVDDKAVLNELYNISDVFIIPSVQDNFPTVSLEAQAAGTPVIAFPTGGIKEQIDKETGWLLSEISSREMAETINGIFMADDFRDNLRRKGANARCRCEKLYSQGIMCNKYEKIYLGRNYENNR
jgi:glycosyltransferase involved in cell wall biosynthesis